MDDDDDSQYHYLRYHRDLGYSKNTPISCRHFQRPPPPKPHRQSTWFELPPGWTHWQPAIVRCPQVTVPPKWDVYNDYGRKSNELMVRDGLGTHQVEADMMWYIKGVTGIGNHVPKIHKVFSNRNSKYVFIIMDYINGDDLYALWPSATDKEKEKVAKQVDQLIRSMQTHTGTFLGPLGFSRPQVFVHPDFPPLVPMDRINYETHLDLLVTAVNAMVELGQPNYTRIRVDKLVLANMHLDPSSFIRDKKGKLWVVGWGKSGFFAPATEIAMCHYLMPARFNQIVSRLLRSWKDRRDEMTMLMAIAKWLDRHYARDRKKNDAWEASRKK
ncbi:hypothetical protein Daesc_009516 [Daldinia eschscholtzii]|uniref:Aminoglycoside phosphotransferase domain-containing protein n=1 Tax=Daldinia eschscholtzii TaxID=292717 RepID=A0AAX6MAI7_9PEZI